MKEEPNFDGTESTEANPAAEETATADPDSSIMDPTKGELDLAEGEDPSEALRVRYNGRHNERIMTRADVSGLPAMDSASVSWSPGSEVAWSWFLELAGSEERAKAVLLQNSHELEVVGPGSDTFWNGQDGEEEFSVGGAVAD